jgi:hypothetical protein
MSLNLAHDEVYTIQHYVINFVSELWQVGGFLLVLWIPPIINFVSELRQVGGFLLVLWFLPPIINFYSELQQVGGFLLVLWFPPPIKLTVTILLKYC